MTHGTKPSKKAPSVSLWMPNDLVKAMDQAAESEGTDRGKFIRRAIRRKLRERASKGK